MAKRRKTTRGRSKHPGVVLKQRVYRSGRKGWVARYTEPGTGRQRDVTLDGTELRLTTAEARTDWAVRLSARLATERAQIASGSRPAKRVTLPEAIDAYFSQEGARLRERTVEAYREGLRLVEAWAIDCGVSFTDELTLRRVVALREYLAALPKRASLAGGKRGTRRATSGARAPATVNGDLRTVRAVLSAWRRRGIVPLSRDDIADGLRLLPSDRIRPSPLLPSELQALLKAAREHDAERWTLTRAERARGGAGGGTPRFDPIAPFVLFVLLSGCRLREAASLQWEQVNLDAHSGAGEVVVVAAASKTHQERAVRLDVSPTLRVLLAGMRLAAGSDRYVFGGQTELSSDSLRSASRRLQSRFGAPPFSWQRLRQTCATFAVNAPSVYGAASAFLSAKRLGHSVAVSERHYLGVVSVDSTARSLESAMGIEREAQRICSAVVRGGVSVRAAS